MLNKLKALREEREEGFTLIELLVVILIIGILAAIAIPVFLNQRQTANDGAVESDIRNASSQVETWIAGQGGKDTALTGVNLTNAIKDIKASTGVSLAIAGSANNYCIYGAHENGKKWKAAAADATADKLIYSNKNGGLNKPCDVTAPALWNISEKGGAAQTAPVVPAP